MRNWLIGLAGLLAVGLGAALAQPQAGAGQSANERLRELAGGGLRWGVLSEKDLVSPEEREALGIEDTGWTRKFGKVHSDVYKSLERAEQVTEPWLDVSGHTGTVYVQVRLKHERRGKADSDENKAAVKQLQTKVLSQLTAAQFYLRYPFQTLPALLGYATRAAIEKLKSDPDVLAVCLDEKPLPQRTERIASEDLPPAAQSDPATRTPDGKVQPDVYRAVALKERVFVLVSLKGSPLEAGAHPQSGAARNLEERLLSAVSADQFWVVRRSPMGSARAPFVTGFVNSSGLATLQGHPLLKSVALDQRRSLEPAPGRP